MKELSIGEVGTIHDKTVLCAGLPWRCGELEDMCEYCAFNESAGIDCPPCGASSRTDKTDVFYPEITKGL